MNKQTIVLLSFIILIFISRSAYGVIAFPYPVEITQPDGTKIIVILQGDEHVKWAQTIDGYAIMRNSDGIFEYAKLDSNIDMVPSGIRVRNVSERTPADNQFLNKIRKGFHYSKSQISMLKSISKMYDTDKQKVFPTTGSRKLVCILIGFTDLAFTKTQAEFYNLYNQVGYTTGGATGSIKDYYLETSYNQFDLTVTVAGPFTASNTMAYYGANDISGNDLRPRELVTEAVNLADPTVNFADFDNDNDGTVDGVYVIYAGFGEEAGASANAIWAHAWNIPTVTKDGKTISKYSCSSELRGTSGTTITAIGVICHEFGHVLGASDYYDTNYGTNGQYNGTGYWDLMASGSWNNNGITPAQHNPYTKITSYAWATATTLTSNTSITLNNAEQNSTSFYRINTQTTNEYFLIENRQQHKFDTNIPGHGMLIYHVDGNFIATAGNAINGGSHQGMYPVCASATGNPPTTYGTINSGGCPFPGTSSKTSFTDATTPNSLSWAGAPTNKNIANITENITAKTVSFDFVLNTIPLATTGAANITSPTAAILNGQVNANGASTTVTFEYGTTTSYGSTINGTPNTVTGSTTTNITATLSGLTTNTLYNFRIKAVNSGGTTYGSNMTFTPMVLTLPVTENFTATTMPTAWSTQNTGTGITERWSISSTTFAGGSANELKCTFMPTNPSPGVTRVITPPINTTGISNLSLSFKHLFVDYGAGVTLRVQSSTDMVTWTNETWSAVSGAGDIGPATVSTTISNNLNSATTYIAFELEGDLYQFDNWYIDNVLLTIGCTAPTTQASAFTSSSITTNSITAGWTRGNGSSVLVVAKQGSAVDASPVDGTTYTASSAFGGGTQIGTGNYVVYIGTSTLVNVSSLSPGTVYYFAIYEYSATNCYKTPPLTGNATTSGTGYCTTNLGGTMSCPGDITALSITGTTLNNTNHTNCSTANNSAYGYYPPSGSNTGILFAGSAYTINVTTSSSDIISLWIDYNKNNIFETSEWTQVTSSSAAGTPASVSFTVPVAAISGQTGLRVRSRWAGNTNGASDACSNFGSGIAEDYVINISPTCTPPSTPVVGTITQPTCAVATGSVVLSSLPSAGTWILTRTPGGVTTTGSGTSTTVTTIPAGTYTFKVTNASGCVSAASANVVITANPLTPATPTVGTITQPTCTVTTGSVILSNLPSTGTWTLKRTPGGTTNTGTGTSTTLTGIPSGTYTYTVTNASSCISLPSANVVINTQPAAPTAPVANAATSVSQTTCSITWSSSASATGYRLDIATNSGFTVLVTGYNDKDLGNVNTYNVTGLTANTTYYYRIRAYNGCGTSLSSNSITFTTMPDPPVPPVAVTPTLISQTSFTANWNSSATATGYRLDVATNSTFTTFLAGFNDKDVSNVNSFAVSGLIANTSYWYRVRAYNAGGTSVSSNTISLTTLPLIPPPPSLLPATDIVQTSFTANWSASTNATGYRLDVATDNGFISFVSNYNDKDVGNVTTFSVTGLTAKTDYYYRLRAYNAGGTSGSSDPIYLQTLPDPPSKPTAISATNILQNSFTARWNSTPTATGYYLNVSLTSGFTSFLPGYYNKNVGNVTSFSVSGLTADTVYYYRIIAFNTGGNSPNSDAISARTLPDPPSYPVLKQAGNLGQTTFTANWNSSAKATGYRLDVATDFSFTSFVSGYNNKDVGNVTNSIVSGLTVFTPYYFRVRAYNTGGTSTNNPTPALTKTLTNPPPAPTGLVASSCNNKITLKWRKNSDPNSYFSKYRIYAGTSSNPTTKVDSATLSINDTSKVISGFTNGQTYYLRVTAVNFDGPESAYSTQASVKVKTGVIPRVKTKFGDILICYNVGDSIKSYQWYKNSAAISKANIQYYVTNKSAGPYYVETVDLNGCVNSSKLINITGTKSVSVYPNPASESFSLKINEVSEGGAKITILNPGGIKVMEFEVDDLSDKKLKEIPVSHLNGGIYTIQVCIDKNDIYNIKVVLIK